MLNRRQLLATLSAPLFAQTPKPNILFIISDDHQWQCLGAAGNPHIQTPNLDKLAKRGMMFTNGIISTSQCAPSRAILLSGQESYQNGLDSNGHTGFRFFKGDTVVEQMRKSGYQTSLVGKWHIDPSPKQCGFTNAPVWMQPAAMPYMDPKLRHGLEATADTDTPGHITEIFTREAVKVVQSAKSPYLLWLAYNAPHTPWTASEKFLKLYQGRNAQLAPPAHPKPPANPPAAAKKKGGPGGGRADGAFDWETYYAVLTEMDAGIGRVVDAVEKAGQWNNTLILFLGDNGYLCGSKGFQGKVRPWEESVRVPYFASGGIVKSVGKSDAAVASIDIPATMLDYAGVRPSHKLSGTSFRAALSGGKFTREVAFSSWNDGRVEALFAGVAVEPYRVARTSALKYIVWESKKEALFDLRSDPFEEKNLAPDPFHAGQLRKMKGLLQARLKETSDRALAWLS